MMKRFALLQKPRSSRRMQTQLRLRSLLSVSGIVLLCSLTVLLSACTLANPFFVPSKSGTSTTLSAEGTPTQVASSTPTQTRQTISLQVVGCPSTLSINWDKLVGSRSGVNKVQKVACGSLEGAGTLEALINVRYYSSNNRLDVYAYDNLYGTPIQRFKATGLVDGDAQISPSGTIMTAEIGSNGFTSVVPNIFKEYAWNGSSFAQALFPGIFPDMTHYQAEQDQALVASDIAAGRTTNTWKLSGTSEATHLAHDVFGWASTSTTVIKNNQVQDTVIVQVTNSGPGGGGFIATLHHLDGNANDIYLIESVAPLDPNIVISSPAPGVQVRSPAGVKGVTQSGNGILGKIVLYDDTFVVVGSSGSIPGPASKGYASFSNSVSFQLNASSVQEGVIVFFSTNQNNLSLTNQVVMVKVFLAA